MTSGACGAAIYGMGRSGTSAVTGLFAASGYFVGAEEDLLPANEGNPAGYYENRNTLQLNDEILHELGGSWFDPPSEERMARVSERYRPRLQAAFDDLLDAADGAPLAIKDPRLQVMMPLWGPVIVDRLHPVIVVRDPIEIASSLERRDGTPRPFSLAAWEISMTRLLRALRGRSVVVAPYGVILGSPDQARVVVQAASAALEPARRERVHPSGGEGWLRADLHRNQASGADHEREMTLAQERLWMWLAALEVGERTLNPPEELLTESAAAERAVAQESTRLRVAARLETQEQELQAVRSELEAARSELQSVRSAERAAREEAEQARRLADEERGARSRADAARADAQATLDVITRSRSWRLTAAARHAADELRRRRSRT